MNRYISKTVAAPIVMDATAFGKLYSSPGQLATFEQDAGQTNKSRVRIEATPRSASSGRPQQSGSQPHEPGEEDEHGKSTFTVRTDCVVASTGKPAFYGDKVTLDEKEAKELLKDGKVSKE